MYENFVALIARNYPSIIGLKAFCIEYPSFVSKFLTITAKILLYVRTQKVLRYHNSKNKAIKSLDGRNKRLETALSALFLFITATRISGPY